MLLRQQLGVLSGVGGSGNHLTSLQPAPPFTVLQPTNLPGGWQLLVRAYSPNQANSGQTPLPAPMVMMVAAGAGGKVDAAVAQSATDQTRHLLANSVTPTLVLIYATSAGQLIDLVELSSSGRSLPAGTPVTIHQATGAETQDGANAVLTWVEQGTWLELHTPLGQAASLQFADQLQPSVVTSTHATVAQTVLPTRVPLAQRVAAVTIPTISDAVLTARCRAWQAEPDGQLAITGSKQATCIAQAVVGAGEFPSVGVSVIPWHDLAAQLGLNPARGPAGDPLVLAVELEDGSGVASWQVILDKGTGHPALLVQLTRGQ